MFRKLGVFAQAGCGDPVVVGREDLPMRRVVFALLSSAVLAAACSTSRAEIGVADIVNPNSFLRGGGPTMFRGFRFSIDTQIAVTALGFFDYRGNGLDAPTPTILISLD
ncbi:MAG TPA: hypothetical protein PK308_06320, partial [Phycisphaerales bacterium]|nr:hypothetical protein [Phycisphaerales bacterium]